MTLNTEMSVMSRTLHEYNKGTMKTKTVFCQSYAKDKCIYISKYLTPNCKIAFITCAKLFRKNTSHA